MRVKTMLARFICAFLLVAASACATASGTEDPVRPNYYVMRHLQKATGDDPGLTDEGQRNAARLADLLADDPPASIYVSSTRRARETAAVLASRLGLTPKTYDPRDTPALIAAVTAETGTVLIVGHSNTVPDIVERLGGTRPADLAETDFGDVWRVFGPDRRVEHLRIDGD
jgi:broad specificity phosphatase PhoE